METTYEILTQLSYMHRPFPNLFSKIFEVVTKIIFILLLDIGMAKSQEKPMLGWVLFVS